MRKNVLEEKSFLFSVRIVNLVKFLNNDKKEYVLAKQILRSGTSIGALLSEAKFGQSTADFINKLYIALKEANETLYWLKLLKETDYIGNKVFESLFNDCNELVAMLVASIKTLKSK